MTLPPLQKHHIQIIATLFSLSCPDAFSNQPTRFTPLERDSLSGKADRTGQLNFLHHIPDPSGSCGAAEPPGGNADKAEPPLRLRLRRDEPGEPRASPLPCPAPRAEGKDGAAPTGPDRRCLLRGPGAHPRAGPAAAVSYLRAARGAAGPGRAWRRAGRGRGKEGGRKGRERGRGRLSAASRGNRHGGEPLWATGTASLRPGPLRPPPPPTALPARSAAASPRHVRPGPAERGPEGKGLRERAPRS